MQGDIWPVMFSDSRSRATTRPACRVLHDTPRQLQNATDSLLHECSAPSGSEKCDLTHSRACLSDSDALWSAGVAKEHTLGQRLTKLQMSIAVQSSGMSMLGAPTAAIWPRRKCMLNCASG